MTATDAAHIGARHYAATRAPAFRLTIGTASPASFLSNVPRLTERLAGVMTLRRWLIRARGSAFPLPPSPTIQ